MTLGCVEHCTGQVGFCPWRVGQGTAWQAPGLAKSGSKIAGQPSPCWQLQACSVDTTKRCIIERFVKQNETKSAVAQQGST